MIESERQYMPVAQLQIDEGCIRPGHLLQLAHDDMRPERLA